MPRPPITTAAVKATKRERLARVLEMLVGGVPPGDIRRLQAKEWGCSEQAIGVYITHCRHRIIPSWYEWGDQRVIACELISKLERIHAKAAAKENWTAALRALRQIAELHGLTTSQQQAAKSAGSGDAPVEQVNAIRQVYGQRRFTVDEYQEWVRSMAPRAGESGDTDTDSN